MLQVSHIRANGRGTYAAKSNTRTYIEQLALSGPILSVSKHRMAEVYRGKPQPGFDLEPYQQAEQQARKAGRGMWSQGEKYVSPMEWRRMQR